MVGILVPLVSFLLFWEALVILYKLIKRKKTD